MAKPCIAFLIDPFECSIRQVKYSGDFHDIYKHIECDCYDVARINDKGDGIFIDDEGLFKGKQAFFWPTGRYEPLAGRGLVLGCDDEGESVAPSITLDELKKMIAFVTPAKLNGAVIWV